MPPLPTDVLCILTRYQQIRTIVSAENTLPSAHISLGPTKRGQCTVRVRALRPLPRSSAAKSRTRPAQHLRAFQCLTIESAPPNLWPPSRHPRPRQSHPLTATATALAPPALPARSPSFALCAPFISAARVSKLTPTLALRSPSDLFPRTTRPLASQPRQSTGTLELHSSHRESQASVSVSAYRTGGKPRASAPQRR